MTNNNRHKLILTVTFITSVIYTSLNAQVINKDTIIDLKTKNNQFSIDYFLLPTIIYNSMTFGVNYEKTPKFEHSLKLGASVFFAGTSPISFNVNYNLNIYAKNRKNYLPIWFGLRNTLRDVGYEEGYFPNTLRPSIGLGFGRKAKIFKKLTIRLEFIAGASLNLTNGNYDFHSFNKFSDYSFDKYYPQYNPKVVPALRFKMTFVKKI